VPDGTLQYYRNGMFRVKELYEFINHRTVTHIQYIKTLVVTLKFLIYRFKISTFMRFRLVHKLKQILARN
jgi:hypothetical protein